MGELLINTETNPCPFRSIVTQKSCFSVTRDRMSYDALERGCQGLAYDNRVSLNVWEEVQFQEPANGRNEVPIKAYLAGD